MRPRSWLAHVVPSWTVIQMLRQGRGSVSEPGNGVTPRRERPQLKRKSAGMRMKKKKSNSMDEMKNETARDVCVCGVRRRAPFEMVLLHSHWYS